jgi:succinoglycan biosynthesis protein ExoM
METTFPHICVCVCTFKRGALLERLLESLQNQRTEGRFSFSVVLVDNDAAESARTLVADFAARSVVPILYYVEPRRGIALARNQAVARAQGDFLAFIDDDEFPSPNWLLLLFTAIQTRRVDGVLGPVFPHFDEPPPDWVTKGGFYDRPSYPTGTIIHWRQGRTGNVLLRMKVFEGQTQPFNPAFVTAEDQDFFRRMIAGGRRFMWCHEAAAYEVVPPVRWSRSFVLRRALQRGKASLGHPTSRFQSIGISLIAIPLYGVSLPFLLIWGHHCFMKYLVKVCDHVGRVLAALHLNPSMDKYITE